MKMRYLVFIMITTSLNILFWYYVIAFCGIYTASSSGWLYGSFAGLLLDWFMISLVIPLTRACLRRIIRKYQKAKFLITLEYMIWIIKNFSG